MPPPIRRPRPPSIEERTRIALDLGLIEPDEPLSPRLQIKLANLRVLAERNEDAEDRAVAADPVPEIVATHSRLIEAGLPEHAAARVAAALAPGIAARATTTDGAAHAPQ